MWIATRPSLYHYDGVTISKAADFDWWIQSMFVAAADDVWVTLRRPGPVGSTDVPAPADFEVERFRGTRTDGVSTSNTISVTGTAANDVWLVGFAGASHWDGASFNEYPVEGTSQIPILQRGVTAEGRLWATDSGSACQGESGTTSGACTSTQTIMQLDPSARDAGRGGWSFLGAEGIPLFALGADDLWIDSWGPEPGVERYGRASVGAPHAFAASGRSDDDVWIESGGTTYDAHPRSSFSHWDGHALTEDALAEPPGVLVSAISIGAHWGFAGDTRGTLFCRNGDAFEAMTSR